MTDSGGRGTRRDTPPFAGLLAKSLVVSVVGGAFFGAVFTLALGVVGNYQAGSTGDVDLLRVVADGSVILLLATAWGLLLALPVALPAGAIAAGLIWYLRGMPWRPARVTWILVGTVAGIAVAACLAAVLAPVFLLEGEPLVTIAMATGGACGALLACLEWPKRSASDAEQPVAADEVRVG